MFTAIIRIFDDETINQRVIEYILSDDASLIGCPITCDYMINPVVIADGNVYDRTGIMSWFSVKKESPLTRQNMENTAIIKVDLLLDLITYIDQLRSLFCNNRLVIYKGGISIKDIGDNDHVHGNNINGFD